jgi:hypothetical protein
MNRVMRQITEEGPGPVLLHERDGFAGEAVDHFVAGVLFAGRDGSAAA